MTGAGAAVADHAALDDAARRAATDPGDFWKLVAGLPDQAAEAWDAGRAWAASTALATPRRVVVVGVGGSAIGADMIAALGSARTTTPIEVVRDYAPPALDADSLLVACSFSGDTEEVLAAFEAAEASGAARAAITTGGRLAECAARAGAPAFTYAFPGPPRTALGYGALPLLALLRRLGVLDVADDEVARAVETLRACAEAAAPGVPAASNPAKQIAARMAGRVPVVAGPGALRVAAARWAGVIAENASQWAFALELPELDHNLVAGFAAPAAALDRLHVVLLDGAGVAPPQPPPRRGHRRRTRPRGRPARGRPHRRLRRPRHHPPRRPPRRLGLLLPRPPQRRRPLRGHPDRPREGRARRARGRRRVA